MKVKKIGILTLPIVFFIIVKAKDLEVVFILNQLMGNLLIVFLKVLKNLILLLSVKFQTEQNKNYIYIYIYRVAG